MPLESIVKKKTHKVLVTIEFDKPVSVSEAIEHAQMLKPGFTGSMPLTVHDAGSPAWMTVKRAVRAPSIRKA